MASPINVARSLDAAFEASPAPKVASPHAATSAPLPPAAGPATTAASAAVPSAAAAAKRKRAEAKQREAWAGVAAVGECVVDMEREIAATLRQQRKLATVARRTLSECEDRSRWLQSVADAVAIEQRLMATMRTELERDIALTQRREDATRQAAAGHRHIPADGFSALAAEEEAADERLAALEREAEALKRVMERLTEREAASKVALEKLDAREAALRTGHRAHDTARRENAVAELHLEDRERAATRHDAEIARWSTSLDAREAELMRRSRHLEECFSTLARAERSLGLAAQPTNVGFTNAAGAGAHHVSIDRDDFSSTSSDDE